MALNIENWSGTRFIRTKLLINLKNNNEIQYIHDGAIIRSDQVKEAYIRPEILTNLEQIQYLQWKGDFENNKKIGRWIATWMGNTLNGVGGQYINDGKKHGKWKELVQNYWKEAQVYEEGEYVNGLRKGYWKYNYQDKKINGGIYNDKGEKDGQWTELSKKFWDKSQIIYNGEYKNGQKVGRWDIWWKKDYDDKIKVQIGGGSYDEEHSFQIGKWVELSEGFWDNSQVILKGEYKNGNKIDLWTIEAFGQSIGGGSYNQDSMKIGNWIELCDGFNGAAQIIYQGQYLNGKKVGKWDICYRENENHNTNYDEKHMQIHLKKVMLFSLQVTGDDVPNNDFQVGLKDKEKNSLNQKLQKFDDPLILFYFFLQTLSRLQIDFSGIVILIKIMVSYLFENINYYLNVILNYIQPPIFINRQQIFQLKNELFEMYLIIFLLQIFQTI